MDKKRTGPAEIWLVLDVFADVALIQHAHFAVLKQTITSHSVPTHLERRSEWMKSSCVKYFSSFIILMSF